MPDELRPLPDEDENDGPPLPEGWEADPSVWKAQMVDNKKALGPLPKARLTLNGMDDTEIVTTYGAGKDDILAWYGEV
jgi:hypothetical protein